MRLFKLAVGEPQEPIDAIYDGLGEGVRPNSYIKSSLLENSRILSVRFMLGWEGDLGQMDPLTLAAGELGRSIYVDVGYRFRDCVVIPHQRVITILY